MKMNRRLVTLTPSAGRLLVALVTLAFALTPAMGQATPADKDAEIQQLRARVAELEQQLAAVKAATQPASGGVAAAESASAGEPPKISDAERLALRNKARQRARRDAAKYTPEQLAECEQLYQTANENWRSPEAIAALKQMVEKYPDVNRTGCAVLYLGQMSDGQAREKYLKQAVDNHSDSFYFNGVQVGGFARYLLGAYYNETGRPEEAKKLLTEVLMKYPDAITHSGHKLAPIVKKELSALRPAAAAPAPTTP